MEVSAAADPAATSITPCSMHQSLADGHFSKHELLHNESNVFTCHRHLTQMPLAAQMNKLDAARTLRKQALHTDTPAERLHEERLGKTGLDWGCVA